MSDLGGGYFFSHCTEICKIYVKHIHFATNQIDTTILAYKGDKMLLLTVY